MENTSDVFDQTASEYDDITELSYAWYYSRLHWLIAKNVIEQYRPEAVLDMACGTGFQSYLHTAGGSYAVGIDIAENLLKTAKKKRVCHSEKDGLEIFPPHYDFVKKYHRKIGGIMNLNGDRPKRVRLPAFLMADTCNTPFGDGCFDHVNIIGALSYMKNYKTTIAEAGRVLKPNGTLFLETECRWNFQALWRVVNYLTGGALGEQTTLSQIREFLLTDPRKNVAAKFPFRMYGEVVSLDVRYFTFHRLKKTLGEHGFEVVEKWPVLSITNLIPWTWLDRVEPSARMKKAFLFLAGIEEKMPFFFPGIGLSVLARKVF